jgi:hypothetical protein
VAPSQADFDKLVQAARELLGGGSMISLGRLAARSGLGEATLRELFDDAPRHAALERAVSARWIRAEGGLFLVK